MQDHLGGYERNQETPHPNPLSLDPQIQAYSPKFAGFGNPARALWDSYDQGVS